MNAGDILDTFNELLRGLLAALWEGGRDAPAQRPPRGDDESLAGLLRQGRPEELGEVLLRVQLQDGGPNDAALDLKEAVKVLQPLHLVVQLP